MAKDVDLTSRAWCDLVFEGKNKEYGAYELRKTSSKRHLIALVAIGIICILAILFVKFKDSIIPPPEVENIVEANVLSQLDQPKEEDKPEEVKPLDVPPPPIATTIQFTAPVIVEKADKEAEIKDQETLKDPNAQISTQTNIGDTKNVVDTSQVKVVKAVTAAVPEAPLVVAEQMPEFPGGKKELAKFLSKNFRYPAEAVENNVQGTVMVRFVVDTDGSINNISVIRPLDKVCNDEALRVVKLMPKWIPGMQNGHKVKVWYQVPFVFKLEQQ